MPRSLARTEKPRTVWKFFFCFIFSHTKKLWSNYEITDRLPWVFLAGREKCETSFSADFQYFISFPTMSNSIEKKEALFQIIFIEDNQHIVGTITDSLTPKTPNLKLHMS